MQRKSDPIKRVVLSNGEVRYRFRVDVGHRPKLDPTGQPVLDAQGRPVLVRDQRTVTCRSLKEARAERARIIAERARGTFVRPSKVTVAEAVARWLAGRRNLRPGTERTYRDALQAMVNELGHLRMQEVSRADIDRAVTRLLTSGRRVGTGRRTGLAPRTVNIALTLLQRVFKDAVRAGEVARNPVELVERPKETHRERQTWTAEQVAAFLEYTRDDRLAVVWQLAATLGLRRGEICGLRWEDVDLMARTVTIRNARTVSGEKVYEGPPKTTRSRRTLPLDDELVAAFDRLQLRQREERERAAEAYQPVCEHCGGGHVVVDELGRPLHPQSISLRFNRLAAEAGLPRIRLHDVRHTCGSLMHLNGVPVATISEVLGHSRPSFTMSVYVHSQEPEKARAVRTLRSVLTTASRADVTKL